MSIEITPALLAEWKEKAWSYVEWENLKGEHENPRYFSDKASFEQIATPDVVLALVAEVERLRNRLDAIECPNCGHPPKFCMCDEQTSGNETNFVTKGEHNG
jgi:hypothetical protein